MLQAEDSETAIRLFREGKAIFADARMNLRSLLSNNEEKKYKWDDSLKAEEKLLWERLQKSWNKTINVIPRQIFFPSTKEKRLHVFVHASTQAYAAAIYNREIVNGLNRERSGTEEFSHEKNTSVPVQGASVPRLELLAAFIGVRLLEFVKKQLSMEEVKSHYWSDSKCVFHWINSDKEVNTTFIENRLKQMRSTGKWWSYKQLSVEEVESHYWSYSKCVFHWIHSDKEVNTTFIENRLKQMRSTGKWWSYV
uniref:RNase H domain-containing protein n=1 Tax=Ascaris lumbricoides TaxID=6252 RepID=A0A0M3HS75_ASCLU